MKKNIILILSLCTAFAQAMEPENKWSITAYGTTINLHKADILEYYAGDIKKEDIVICVGQHKQEELGATPIWGNLTGECCEQKTVRFIPKSDSINYGKARTSGWDFPQREGIQFLVVTEPRVFNRGGEDSKYWCDDSELYTKEAAITESCKYLLCCYNAVLNKGKELLQEKDIKNIALPMLGADSQYEHARMFKEDVATIAVNAVLEFLKNQHGAYNNVEFFVEDDADVTLYKKLLMEQCGLTEKVLLFWLAHYKDSQSMFTLLPRELIYYIAQLI